MSGIFLLSENRMFRQSLSYYLKSHLPGCVINDFDNVGEMSGQSFVPELVICNMQNAVSGFKSLRSIMAAFADVKILIIGNGFSANDFRQMISLGVKGWMSEFAGLNELKNTINEISEGKIVFPHDILQSIMLNSKKETVKQCNALTEREIEILQLLCDELSNEEISEKLHLSYDTIKWHRSNILVKCECKNILSLYKYAVRHKLIQVSKGIR